jgi:DNA-binding NarL/FixJ family response regulator
VGLPRRAGRDLSQHEHGALLTNTAISDRLHLARRTVDTHASGVFTKLRLAPTLDDHRRVQAVLAYVRHDA